MFTLLMIGYEGKILIALFQGLLLLQFFLYTFYLIHLDLLYIYLLFLKFFLGIGKN